MNLFCRFRERERERVTKTISSFTLIELLIVVAIIGILAAAIIVSLVNANNQAKYQTMRAQMKEIADAANMYFLNEGNGADFAPGWNQGYQTPFVPEYLTAYPRPPWNDRNCVYQYQNCDQSRGGITGCSSQEVWVRAVDDSTWGGCDGRPFYGWCIYTEPGYTCNDIGQVVNTQ